MNVSVPVTLEHHFFPHISIAANPEYVSTRKPLDASPVVANLNVAEVKNGNNRFMVELHVHVVAGPGNGLPYSFDILCIGYATIQGKLPADVPAKGVVADIGQRVLFPAVRELILSLTARQPWGQFSIGMGLLGRKPPPAGETTSSPMSAKSLKGPTKRTGSIAQKSDKSQPAVSSSSARKKSKT